MARKRRSPSATKREMILARQGFACNRCGTPFGTKIHSHINHIDGDRSNDDMSNLEALCPNCHDHITRTQRISEKPSRGNDDALHDFLFGSGKKSRSNSDDELSIW